MLAYEKAIQESKATCGSFELRADLVHKFSWAIPNIEAIEAIKSLNMTVTEVGAGKGYWAYEFSRAGVKVMATDAVYPNLNSWTDKSHSWHPIELKDGVDAARRAAVNGHALLIVWPHYTVEDGGWCDQALQAYWDNGGECVIYVGEDDWGCTGTPKFHRLLECYWEQMQYVDIPSWDGISDGMHICLRRDNPQGDIL